MPEKKIKHLEMIEAIIERMAKNCFQLKGWTMTLVALLGALGTQGSEKKFMLLAFIPLIGFCFLDAYYLQQERKYKQLYKNVAEKDENDINFSMDTGLITGSTSEMKHLCYYKCLFSISVIVFYGVIAFAMLLLFLVLSIENTWLPSGGYCGV